MGTSNMRKTVFHQRWGIYFVLALFLATIVGSTAQPLIATIYAAPATCPGPAKWLNQTSLQYDTNDPVGTPGCQTYNQLSINGDQMSLRSTTITKGAANRCTAYEIVVGSPPGITPVVSYLDATSAQLGNLQGTYQNGKCVLTGNPIGETPIQITPFKTVTPPGTLVTGSWTNANPGQITVGSGAAPEVFNQTSINNNEQMLLAGDQVAHCGADAMSIGTVGTDNTVADSYQDAVTATVTLQEYNGSTCQPVLQYVKMANSFADVENTVNNATSTNIPCPITTAGLGWLMCAIFQLGTGTIGQLNTLISGALYTPTDQIFGNSAASTTNCTVKNGTTTCTAGSKGTASFQAAFDTFRDIALAMLVIAALVMVVSQASGLELFAAYTVHKSLPRIVIAAIVMAVAWPLMEFGVTFFNDIGSWAGALILAATHVSTGSSPTTVTNITAGVLGTVTAVGSLAVLGGLGILSLIGTILLALFVGFVVLAIRQLIILVCILIAPLGIAAFVFPGTKKMAHFWRDALLGALIMFPATMATLGAGAALATIAGAAADAAGAANNGGSQTSWQMIAIFVCFIPYFLIPLIWRATTGAMGTLTGAVHDRHRGAFNGLRNIRHKQMAQNVHDMGVGTRFKFKGRLSRLNDPLNAMTSRTATFASVAASGNNPFNANNRNAAYEQKMFEAAAAVAKSPMGAKLQHNDPALRAMSYESEAAALAGLQSAADWGSHRMSADEAQRAVAAVRVGGGFGRAQQIWAAGQLSATGTGYDDQHQEARTIARTSHGNEELISASAGYINSMTKGQGRHDLAPGFGKLNELARMEAGVGGPVTTATATAMYSDAAEAAWNSASLYQHANDKELDIQNAIDHFTPMLRSNDADERQRAGVFYNELKAMLPNASGGVKNRIQETLEVQRGNVDALYAPSGPKILAPSMTVLKAGTPIVEDVFDPATGNYRRTVTPTAPVGESARDRVERLSRTWERPDPNTL